MRRACLVVLCCSAMAGCTGGMAGHERSPDGARQVAEGFFDAVATIDAGMACDLLTVTARAAAGSDCHQSFQDLFDDMPAGDRRAMGDLGVEAVQVRGDRAVVRAGARSYDLAYEDGRWRLDPRAAQAGGTPSATAAAFVAGP